MQWREKNGGYISLFLARATKKLKGVKVCPYFVYTKNRIPRCKSVGHSTPTCQFSGVNLSQADIRTSSTEGKKKKAVISILGHYTKV